MTDIAPEAIEAVTSVIHDNAWYVDGSDLAAVAVVEFIRDAIHRDGDDADAIRQALGLVQDVYFRDRREFHRPIGLWQEVPQ